MDRGAWQATVHGVAKSQAWPSSYHSRRKSQSFYEMPWMTCWCFRYVVKRWLLNVQFKVLQSFTVFWDLVDLQCCAYFRCTAKRFSYTCICICFFQILFPYRLLQNIEYSSLWYTVGPCCLSILHIITNPILLSPSPLITKVCFLCLWVCLIKKLICILFFRFHI